MRVFVEYDDRKGVEESINAALRETVIDWQGTPASHKSVAPERELIKSVINAAGLTLVALDMNPNTDYCVAFVESNADTVEHVFFI